MTWKHSNPKSVGCFKREVCGNTILIQETIKASNRQPQLTCKTTGKEEQKQQPTTTTTTKSQN